LQDTGRDHGALDLALHGVFEEMMPAPGAGARIAGRAFGGKYVLPSKLQVRPRILSLERMGKFDAAESAAYRLLMEVPCPRELAPHRFDHGIRKEGHAILGALAVSNLQKPPVEAHVLGSQMEGLEEPQSAAVKQRSHEMVLATKVAEDRENLFA